MEVNAIFEAVKVYKVQDRLDVVMGETFTLEVTDGPEGLEVFTNDDPVLQLDGNDVSAIQVGNSKIRYMNQSAVIKDIDIYVVTATHPNATTLGGSLGEPQPK